MASRDKNVAALLKLRWVAKVTKYRGEYTVTTKAGVLRTNVPNRIKVTAAGTAVIGKVIKGGISVPLPSYELRLSRYYLCLRMASVPRSATKSFYPYPARVGRINREQKESWMSPCMGRYDGMYQAAYSSGDYVGAALAVAEYLQVAVPDSSLGFKLHSLFAYYMGLMPEQYIERTPAVQPQAEGVAPAGPFVITIRNSTTI